MVVAVVAVLLSCSLWTVGVSAAKAKGGGGGEDYYSLLGISRDASDADIKRAYKKLALTWHPDVYKGDDVDGAKKKFQRISEGNSSVKCRPLFLYYYSELLEKMWQERVRKHEFDKKKKTRKEKVLLTLNL